jgi:hypothetical protein
MEFNQLESYLIFFSIAAIVIFIIYFMEKVLNCFDNKFKNFRKINR